MSPWYKQEDDRLVLNIYVQPGAKRNEIAGFHGNELKIRLSSPPVDGRANEALLKYLAELFDVPLRQVQLKQGDKSRHKKVVIIGGKPDLLL